jgi:hypothetical protein
LALSLFNSQLWSEAAEAYKNSIHLYSKLQLKIHQTFAVGDYFFCLLQIANGNSVGDADLDIDVDLDKLQAKPIEYNIYQVLAHGALIREPAQKVKA